MTTVFTRVTLIVGIPPRPTLFWIISSQISSKSLKFPSIFPKFSLKFSISSQPEWQAVTNKVTLVFTMSTLRINTCSNHSTETKGGKPKDQSPKSIEVFRERRIDKDFKAIDFSSSKRWKQVGQDQEHQSPPLYRCDDHFKTRPSILCVTPKMTFRTCLTQTEDMHKPYGLYVRVVLDSKWWNWINKGQY